MNNWEEVDGYWKYHDWENYQHLINGLPDNSFIVEVGSFRGKSLASVADLIKRKNLKVWSVDIFDKVVSENYVEPDVCLKKDGMLADFKKTLQNFGLTEYVTINVMESLTAASLVKEKNIYPDFVFLDGDHSYEYVSKEIKAWYPLIKTNGILAFHDFDHNALKWPGVHKAVTEKFKAPAFGVYIAAVRKLENGQYANDLFKH